MKELDVSDITLYADYLETKNEDFGKNLYIPYLIGSPIHLYKDSELSKKNDALVPVVILIKKENATYDFEEVVFSWNSIDLLQTYSRIDSNGQLHYLGNHENYQNMFKEKMIEVQIDDIKELSLTEVIKEHQYYSKLPNALLEKYKKERFLMFSYQNNKYIVPTIEVVRYFYCFSKSDSLKQAIFHPRGIGLLVKRATRETGSNRRDLYLETICVTADHKKVFYFTYKKKFLEMFHSVYFHYKKDGIVKAQFPFEESFQMACKILKLKTSPNTFLVTRIIASDMLNSFFKTNNIDLHVHHPLSKEKEEKTGKRDPKKDKKRKVPKRNPSNFDDKLSTFVSIPPQNIGDDPNEDYFPDEDTPAMIKKNGKRNERGGKTVDIPVDITDSSTRNGQEKASAQKVITSSSKAKIDNYPEPKKSITTPDINDTSLVMNEFKLKGFLISSINVYDFPDKTNSKKRAISYTDNKMLKQRRYIVLKLAKADKNYIYLDVEEKNSKKEVLFLIGQSENIAHRCIYQQVYYGNHKWLTKESLNLKDGIDFIRMRHTVELVKNIIAKIK